MMMEEHPLQHSNSNQKLPTTGPAAAAYHQWCRFILDLILFYTTAFFVLLAIVSLFALVFLVPFFIDPAWSTLQADFDPNGTVCTTLSGKYLKGRSYCDWSSCQEGCTKTVYTCWQVTVEYEIPGINPGSDIPKSSITAKGKLYPNVKGCGYPPVVDCQNFMNTYGTEGINFTCYVSRLNPDLVVVDLDLQIVKNHLFYSLAVPIPCLFMAISYLVIAYKFIYNENKDKQDYRPVVSAGSSSAFAALIDLKDSNESENYTKDYRPVVSAGAGSAFAALIDLKDSDESETDRERQRKLLLQIQKTKWLAQHGKLTTSTSATSGLSEKVAAGDGAPTTSGPNSSSSGSGLDLTKYGSVRMKELQEAHISGHEAELVDQKKKENHMEMIRKDRTTYGTEKHKILHYYQYYNQE